MLQHVLNVSSPIIQVSSVAENSATLMDDEVKKEGKNRILEYFERNNIGNRFNNHDGLNRFSYSAIIL